MYHKCIIVVLHDVNTRAFDTPQIRRDGSISHALSSSAALLIFLSDLLVDISACASSADTNGCPIAADVGWREIGVVGVGGR